MITSDLSKISNVVIQVALDETIQNLLNSRKYNVNICSASQKGGDNFMSIVHRVRFSKENGTENEIDSANLILKIAPVNEEDREQDTRPAFLRENYMYNKVLPVFRQFEQSKGVIFEEHGFSEYPKCYANIDMDLSECIFLEDLSMRGFSMCAEGINADHVRLAMKSLGKFHAISFALKDQEPKKFEELTSNLDELFIRKEFDHWRELFNKQSDSMLKLLSDKEDAALLAKVQKLFEKDALDVAADCLDLESTGPASIITHGDAWKNNMMFSHDDDGKPVEISLIDWQMSRHSSPIIDIVYFIFSSTTKELRDSHYENFLQVYHENLSTHMRRLGSDSEKLFPYDLMLKHFRRFGKFGLIIAIGFLGIMLTSESETETNTNESCNDAKSTKKLNNRLKDVVIDMVRLEYI